LGRAGPLFPCRAASVSPRTQAPGAEAPFRARTSRSRFAGTLLGRFRGNDPAVSNGAGKVTLYNLETAAKLAERKFRDYLSYLCFSENGDRLLVLTVHQMVYILDVKKTIEAFPAAPAPAGEPATESSPESP
jgi:hypothetical protein